MGLRHGCLFHDRQTDEGLEALHSVDVLAFIRQVIILRIIEQDAVSDIGKLHVVSMFEVNRWDGCVPPEMTVVSYPFEWSSACAFSSP